MLVKASDAAERPVEAPRIHAPVPIMLEDEGPSLGLTRLREALTAIRRWRKMRARFFSADLFSDPVWDMLLDLAVARIDGRPLQVSYVGIEAGVPSSTSLRWAKYLQARGLVRRWSDPLDKRRELVELSDDGLDAFVGYVEALLSHETGALLARRD